MAAEVEHQLPGSIAVVELNSRFRRWREEEVHRLRLRRDRATSRHRQRPHLKHALAGNSQRLSTGREKANPAAPSTRIGEYGEGVQ